MNDELNSHDYDESEIIICKNFSYHINGDTPQDKYLSYINELKKSYLNFNKIKYFQLKKCSNIDLEFFFPKLEFINCCTNGKSNNPLKNIYNIPR